MKESKKKFGAVFPPNWRTFPLGESLPYFGEYLEVNVNYFPFSIIPPECIGQYSIFPIQLTELPNPNCF